MKNILITGADGYLGQLLVRRFLQEEEYQLHLWVRASNEEEFEAKKQSMTQKLSMAAKPVRFYFGDLTNDEPFSSVDLKEVDQLIHSAAVTDFNVPQEKALKINVEGTRKTLEFASKLRSLGQFALISSIYASGLKGGLIPEEILRDQEGFSNFYEWSKWASEELLVKEYSNLPWKIIRLATVICDNREGIVEQQNAFHNTLKLFYYGLLSLMPGDPKTTLYFVTGEFSRDAIWDILQKGDVHKVYQVVHRKSESLSLGELVDIAFAAFDNDPDFKARHIMKPLFTDSEAFNLLEKGAQSFTSGIVNQAVSSVNPFARQLFYEKEFSNQNTLKTIPDYKSFDLKKIVGNTCEYLVRTKWGRTVSTYAK